MKLIYVLLFFLTFYPLTSDSANHPGTIKVRTNYGNIIEVSTEGINTRLRPHSNTVSHKILEHGGNKKSLFPEADITVQNKYGESVFLFGVIYSDLETIRFMHELDPSAIYINDYQKRSPLLIGLKHKRPLPIIQFIHLNDPSALFETDKYGSLPLHYVFRYKNSLDVIRYIYKMYPKAMLTPRKDGKTPYDVMRKYMPGLTIAQLESSSNKNLNKNRNRNQGIRKRPNNQCQQRFNFRRR